MSNMYSPFGAVNSYAMVSTPLSEFNESMRSDPIHTDFSFMHSTIHSCLANAVDDPASEEQRPAEEVTQLCASAKKLCSMTSAAVLNLTKLSSELQSLERASVLIAASISRATVELGRANGIVCDDKLAAQITDLGTYEKGVIENIDRAKEALRKRIDKDSATIRATAQAFMQTCGTFMPHTCVVCMERPVERYWHPCGHTICTECTPKCAGRCHLCHQHAVSGRLFFS
jgi:hypothetical protein